MRVRGFVPFVLASLVLCPGLVQAQTFPIVHVPFPGDSSGARVDLGLSVVFNASGYSVPLPDGGTRLFHYQYHYAVTMTDDIKLPVTVITDFDVANCLASLFVAQLPTVLVDPQQGMSHPELFTPPIWTSGSSTIHWSNPVAGPAYGASWQFSFYSDVAPSVGTVTLGAFRVNPDCSIEHPTLVIPYFGPCATPGRPGPCPKPVANAGGPYLGTVGSPVIFDASGSSAGSGATITGYQWSFGDGTTGTGVAPSHTYQSAGTYTVKLTVTNSCGNCDACTRIALIARAPQPVCPFPICATGGPYTGTMGSSMRFDGSRSSTPAGSGPLSYLWTFGDGTVGTGVSPTHLYGAAGLYPVTLAVTNACGHSCTCATTVTITSPPTASPCAPHLNNVAQVYPALPAPCASPFGSLGSSAGDTVTPFPGLSVPGVLCLDTATDHKLNVNAFITCCPGGSVALTSVKLVKTVSGSEQFPDCYPAHTVTQYGRDNIRTWWNLNYTMPNTKFTLTLAGICNTPATPGSGTRIGPGSSTAYSEIWCWTVVANPDTFLLLLDLFHFPEIGQTEVPCILDEGVYGTLVSAAKNVKARYDAFKATRTAGDKIAALDAIQHLEAYILANTLSADWLDQAKDVILFPNSNAAPNGAGILNTCENPCACKLLVDLEDITNQLVKGATH